MTTGPSIARRLVRLVQRLPESTANSFRFRVPFFLPRWFSVPPEVRVSGKAVKLHFPAGEYAESDFIECFLLNAYGLGHKLGNVRSILDVGANVGFFALAAREYYPDTTIHAYEPNPRVVPLLRANTEGFNVSIYPEAIGSEECFVTVLDEGPSDEARTRRSAESNGAVRQISLATAIERMGGSVDLLKLDCEGAEWEILTLEGCWHGIRSIRAEIHFFNGETLDHAEAALKRAGFEILLAEMKNEEMATIWAKRS